MSFIPSFAPILIILLIIGIFVLLVKNAGRFLYPVKTSWILAGYLVILLFSPVVLYALPGENFMEAGRVSPEALEKASKAMHELYESLHQGRPEQVDGAYKMGQWEFILEESTLVLDYEQNFHDLPMITVEKIKTDSRKVEVTYYVTRTILEMTDVTDQIKTPEVQLVGSRLIFTAPEEFIWEIAKFEKEFVVTQFMEGPEEPAVPGEHEGVPEEKAEPDYGPGNRFFSRNVFGAQALYLRIPEGIEIDDTRFPYPVHIVEN